MGELLEAAVLVFLYSISEAAEGYTEEKTRSAVRALMDLTPKTATVRRGGRDVEVPAEELVPGDVFLVRPGQGVPTDGEVVGGASSVNQAPVTGESILVTHFVRGGAERACSDFPIVYSTYCNLNLTAA